MIKYKLSCQMKQLENFDGQFIMIKKIHVFIPNRNLINQDYIILSKMINILMSY